MNGHTQGPWSTALNRGGSISVISSPDVDGDTFKVDLVNRGDVDNARLIAAAPDLCEAAEEAEGLLSMFYAICADMRDGGKWEPPSEAYILRIQDAVRYTRAAIAKAKGAA